MGTKQSNNPRYALDYQGRVKARKRLLAMAPPTCPLCGRPIDYSLDWYVDPTDGKRKRHPMSPEVDEIVPISKGGSPTDMENLRVVHRVCNQKRGNGTRKGSKALPLPKSGDW